MASNSRYKNSDTPSHDSAEGTRLFLFHYFLANFSETNASLFLPEFFRNKNIISVLTAKIIFVLLSTVIFYFLRHNFNRLLDLPAVFSDLGSLSIFSSVLFLLLLDAYGFFWF